jgi:transcriptional regulator with XRE-family HTH domain
MGTLDKILVLIKQNGVEQQAFAEAIGAALPGKGKSVVSQWKSGKTKTYLNYIKEIAEYFSVSADWLLGVETSAPYKTKLRSIARMQDANLTEDEDKQITEYIEFLVSRREKNNADSQ